MDGAKAPRTTTTYISCFKRWAHYRRLLGKNVLILANDGQINAEYDVLWPDAMQFGPIGKAAVDANLYLSPV